MYGCRILICFLGGFCSVVILFCKIEVQSWLGIVINWCLHMFIFGLIVVISVNSILDSMCCFFGLGISLYMGKFWQRLHCWGGLFLLVVQIYMQDIGIQVVVLLCMQ